MKETLIDLFEQSVARYADKPFLWEKVTQYQSISYRQGREEMLQMAGGWMSLGVQKGDRIALLAEGSNAWILGELSMLYAGAVNVPLSIKLNQDSDLLFRIRHSECRFILVSINQLAKIRAIRSQLDRVERVVVITADTEALEEGEWSLAELKERGTQWNAAHPGQLMEVANALENNDLANITYTSGTMADPKGVMLTHRNFTANVDHSLSAVYVPEFFKTLLILPLDHCFAHVTGFYTFIKRGGEIATVPAGKSVFEYIRNIPVCMREFRPNVIMTVPALAKTFRKNVYAAIQKKGPFFENLFEAAIQLAMAYNKEGYNRGTGSSLLLKPLVALFDRLMFRKLRASLGGELQFFVDGGAYLDVDMQKFWYATGIPMFQGYGLSEATPVISSNSYASHKLGTSGKPAKGIEVCIRDEAGKALPNGEKGEISIRGENVMAGYWKNPEATAAVVKDGWLYTGDLGVLDADGFLDVFGRSKSLLIGSDGEKYSPEGIEESMTSLIPYVDQVVLFNNQRAYTVALIVPNKEALRRALPDLDTMEGRLKGVRLIEKSLNEYKQGGKYAGIFPERWLPAAFALLEEPFGEQNQTMNSTMKLVRGKIESLYARRIEFLYTPDGKHSENKPNLDALA